MVSVFFSNQKDSKNLQLIFEQSIGAKVDSLSQMHIKQERKNIYKEIWQVEGKTRKMIKIQSPASKVLIQEREGVVGLVEELSSCQCWIQDKLFYDKEQPMQEFRHLKAQNASFSYDSKLFTLQEASFYRYLAKGFHFPKQEKSALLLMKGTAKEARLQLQDSGFHFEADHLKATFYEGV